MDTTQIYQAINAVSKRVEEINSRLDYIFNLKINDITPYEETKTAYIDDTEITFENVPQGNLTVFFDKDYEVERIGDKVVISFEALTEVKDITIMIQ